MKTRTLVSISILVLAVLIIVGSCATGKKTYVAKEDEELYGTWVNPDYNYSVTASAKFVVHPNGKMEMYSVDTYSTPKKHAEFVITNRWNDTQGNIWYTINFKNIESKYWNYWLIKISNSEKALELNDSPNDHPDIIDPNDRYSRYGIYYRQ